MTCPVAEFCRNKGTSCDECVGGYAPEDAELCELPLLYYPTYPTDPKHPLILIQKEKRKSEKKARALAKRSRAFQDKSKLVKRAYKEEEATREEIIRATRRSGALFHDGDSRLGDGAWGIDDKRYSTGLTQFTMKTNTVKKAEAQRSVVVVTLSNGEKYVVASLNAFCSAAQEMALTCEKARNKLS